MKFKSELTLAGFTPRVENNGPVDKEGAITIKLTGTIDTEDCRGLFATDVAYETIVERFYRKDGELVTPDLGSIELNTEGVGVKASIKSAFGPPLDFGDRTNIDAITLKLLAGRKVEFKCNLHVHPTDEQVAAVLKLQKQGVTFAAAWKKTKADEDAAKAKQKDLDLKKRKGEEEEDETATA